MMQSVKKLTTLELLERLFSDKFISDYFLNADSTILNDIIRDDLLLTLIEAHPIKEQELIIKRYKNSHVIKTILSNLYEELLADKRKAFPPGTFKGLQGRLNSAILFKYVFVDKLGWNLRKIITELDKKTLYQHKLRSVFQCYPNIYELMKESFPEGHIKPYYFTKIKNIWKNKNKHSPSTLNETLIREAITELVTILTDRGGQYRYSFKQLPQWIRYQHFQKKILPYGANLSYLLETCFNNSPIKAIMFAYPQLGLQPHYFSNVPKGYWKKKENVDKVRTELLKTLTHPKGKFQFTEDELRKFLTFTFYQKPLLPYRKKVSGLLRQGFNNDPKQLLE